MIQLRRSTASADGAIHSRQKRPARERDINKSIHAFLYQLTNGAITYRRI